MIFYSSVIDRSKQKREATNRDGHGAGPNPGRMGRLHKFGGGVEKDAKIGNWCDIGEEYNEVDGGHRQSSIIRRSRQRKLVGEERKGKEERAIRRLAERKTFRFQLKCGDVQKQSASGHEVRRVDREGGKTVRTGTKTIKMQATGGRRDGPTGVDADSKARRTNSSDDAEWTWRSVQYHECRDGNKNQKMGSIEIHRPVQAYRQI